jgi:hypothetical protein
VVVGVFRPGFLSARHAEQLGIDLVPLEQFPEIAPFLFGGARSFAHVAVVLGHEPDQVIPLKRLHDLFLRGLERPRGRQRIRRR